ncbi:MAG: ABC transporter ATP-binding protein [Gammaproteobacteria bacterium]|nr:ABC transporter ATP-binding protein [Gammaproteobacteria bacterium]
MLSITNLNKSFQQAEGNVVVFKDLNFEMATGISVALLGESGSGKSTLLHLIAGLDRVDSGEIQIDHSPVTTMTEAALAELRRQQVSLVFQQFHLISTLNILDNIRFQAALCQRFDNDYEALLIDRLGLASQLRKLPHQLSRGQQQRVAIARSLLHKPALVLADEPTGNLDEQSSLEVMSLFSSLVKNSGSSLLMVTHSREMASYLDRAVLLHNGKLGEIDAG